MPSQTTQHEGLPLTRRQRGERRLEALHRLVGHELAVGSGRAVGNALERIFPRPVLVGA